MTRLATDPTQSATPDSAADGNVVTGTETADPRAAEMAAHSAAVKTAARRLQTGFIAGKNNARNLLIRKIAGQVFAERLGANTDVTKLDKNMNSVFVGQVNDLGKNAEAEAKEIADALVTVFHDVALCADGGVTLGGGIKALDMSKHYVNWRPSAKQINDTYANLEIK